MFCLSLQLKAIFLPRNQSPLHLKYPIDGFRKDDFRIAEYAIEVINWHYVFSLNFKNTVFIEMRI